MSPGSIAPPGLIKEGGPASRPTAVSRSLDEAEDSEGPVHGAAGPSGGFGDVSAPGQAQGADGQVAQGRHDPWPGPGSDPRLVLLIQGVAQPVPGLDRPLPTDVAREVRGAGLVRAWAGDAEGGHRGQRVAVQAADVALDQQDLADVTLWGPGL